MSTKKTATKVANEADVYVARAAEWDKAQKTIKRMISAFKSKAFEDVCLSIFSTKKELNVKKLETILKGTTFVVKGKLKHLCDDKGKVTFFVKNSKGEWKEKTRKYSATSWCMKDFMFLMFLVAAAMQAKQRMVLTSTILSNATAVADLAA